MSVRSWQSIKELAEEIGCTPQAVRLALRRGVVERRDATPSEKAVMAEAHAAAKKVGQPPTSVWRLAPQATLNAFARRGLRKGIPRKNRKKAPHKTSAPTPQQPCKEASKQSSSLTIRVPAGASVELGDGVRSIMVEKMEDGTMSITIYT